MDSTANGQSHPGRSGRPGRPRFQEASTTPKARRRAPRRAAECCRHRPRHPRKILMRNAAAASHKTSATMQGSAGALELRRLRRSTLKTPASAPSACPAATPARSHPPSMPPVAAAPACSCPRRSPCLCSSCSRFRCPPCALRCQTLRRAAWQVEPARRTTAALESLAPPTPAKATARVSRHDMGRPSRQRLPLPSPAGHPSLFLSPACAPGPHPCS